VIIIFLFKLHPGIPNKSSEETLGHDLHDNLGFLLGESPFNLPKEECINEEDEVNYVSIYFPGFSF
jgi:hypothetical protein